MTQRQQGLLCAALAAVIFGSMPLAANILYGRGANAESLVLYRNLLALPFLFFLMRRQGCRPLGKKQLAALAVLAFLNTATPLLVFKSYYFIPTGMATTIHFVYPVFVLLGAAVFCGERITPVKALCVGLCTLGVALFYTPGEALALEGMGLAFLSSITFAAYVVLLDKSGLKNLPPFQMVFWLCVFGTIFMALGEGPRGQLRFGFGAPDWALLVLFAFTVSVGGVGLFQTGVRKVGPSQTSILNTFEPLTSIVWGVLLLGEGLTPRTALGMGAILTAVVLLAVKGGAPEPAKAEK